MKVVLAGAGAFGLKHIEGIQNIDGVDAAILCTPTQMHADQTIQCMRAGKNVIRGLHYQVPPHPQAKLLRVVAGEIFDVAVDIRRSSPNFGKWTGAVLSAENKRMLWIPEGFAHGLLALSGECERAIRWDDPVIGIDWPLSGEVVVSERDRGAPGLSKAEVFV